MRELINGSYKLRIFKIVKIRYLICTEEFNMPTRGGNIYEQSNMDSFR